MQDGFERWLAERGELATELIDGEEVAVLAYCNAGHPGHDPGESLQERPGPARYLVAGCPEGEGAVKILIVLALLAGCATAPVSTTTRVPIPVECKELVPDRPIMATEEFTSQPTLDAWIQAAMAELLRREGYEGKLRAALVACTTPIEP